MKINVFTPLNPEKTGISDYSEELIATIQDRGDVDICAVVHGGYTPKPNLKISKILTHQQLDKSSPDCINIYQLGNSRFHSFMLNIIYKEPGIVVLHDFDLFMLHRIHYGVGLTFLRKAIKNHGWLSIITLILKTITFMLKLAWYAFKKHVFPIYNTLFFFVKPNFMLPMAKEIIKTARGVIVHNEFVLEKIEKMVPGKKVKVIRHGVTLPKIEDKRSSRRKFSIKENVFVISSVGFVNEFKKLDYALVAFKRFLQVNQNALYIIAGGVSGKINIRKIIEQLGISDNVLLLGYVKFETFLDAIQASDIMINLRHCSIQGETSGSLLRIMSLGKPAIISNFNQYRELPDDTCVKINSDKKEREIKAIYSAIVDLYYNPLTQSIIGKAAQKYVTKNHNWQTSAEQYIRFAKDVTS